MNISSFNMVLRLDSVRVICMLEENSQGTFVTWLVSTNLAAKASMDNFAELMFLMCLLKNMQCGGNLGHAQDFLNSCGNNFPFCSVEISRNGAIAFNH